MHVCMHVCMHACVCACVQAGGRPGVHVRACVWVCGRKVDNLLGFQILPVEENTNCDFSQKKSDSEFCRWVVESGRHRSQLPEPLEKEKKPVRIINEMDPIFV